MMTSALTGVVVLALGASCAHAADIGYLAPPGEPAEKFPSPQRPVAQIVSPSRSSEECRDALNESGQIAGVLEIKRGMTVADIGAGNGYHTVRLSPVVGLTSSVIAEDVTRDYLSSSSGRRPTMARQSRCYDANWPRSAIAPSPPISSRAIADISRCFRRPRQASENHRRDRCVQ
jgi:predicted methyltransferase